MNRITIITKLRAVAAIAPAILIIVGLAIAGAFYVFGATPRALYDTQYMSARAADGMEAALFKMDWGRTQADGGQIVMDQQRRFVSWVDSARAHADSQDQLDTIQKIAAASVPVFDSLRKAAPGDDTVEPAVRNLEGLVADLSSADEASMLAVVARAESSARVMLIVAVAGVIILPWVCFVALYRMSGAAGAELREIRRNFTALDDRGEATAPEFRKIDESLAALGFAKPNPMLAEE
jgi:hypothetical protein